MLCAYWSRSGVCYEGGQGVSKDLKLAAKYYQLAADSGFIQGLHNLAGLYREGEGGIPKNENLPLNIMNNVPKRGS